MAEIYSYRIIIQAEQSNSNFNLDLYTINNEVFGITLYDRLEAFMSTNQNRADLVNPIEEISNDSDKINFVCYFDRTKLFTGDQEITTIDEIVSIVVAALQEAAPTREGLPKPPIYTWTGGSDTNSYGGIGEKRIYNLKNQQINQQESYIPDTTPFKRRGLVKIQGEDEYNKAGQALGKNLTSNTSVVASDNSTHISASETDEQVENSVAVSVWYFKNKTTQNLDTIEYKSKISKETYTNEYNRIKGILG